MSDDRSSISGSDLRYPLYLDVPMMISFLASLQDGIAYDKTVNRKTARGRKRWGQAEAGLKLPPVTALLSFNAQGKLAREGKQDESEEEQVVRRHTEASFFNILYKALLDDGAVRNIDSLDQADWTELHSGELVQVTGEVFRNPLQQVVHFHENRPAPLRLKHQTDQQEDVGTNDESAKQADNDMAEMFQQLGQELRSASLQDLIFRPACKKDYTMVLTLKQVSGTEHALDDFLESESVVLGKLTKTITNGDYINLLRRTSVKYMPEYNELLEAYLGDLGFANILSEDTIVKAPSIQIRPLAIFT